jgi:hypothetical protein
VQVLGKNTTAGNPLTSDHGLSERRTGGQEMEVNTMEEGEINDVAGEEVFVEDGLRKGKE